MSGDESSWKRRAEFYEKQYQILAKELLRFKKRIDDLSLESGWKGVVETDG